MNDTVAWIIWGVACSGALVWVLYREDFHPLEGHVLWTLLLIGWVTWFALLWWTGR